MSNLSKRGSFNITQNPYFGINLFDSQNPSLSPYASQGVLHERLKEQILACKSLTGEVRLNLDQWLISQGLNLKEIELVHKNATSQLHANLLINKWEDTYTISSFLAFPSGVILGGSGFFGGFGLAVSTATFFGGFAFITLPLFAFGGAAAGGILGLMLVTRFGKSFDYVPKVAEVYAGEVIKAIVQKKLGSGN